MARSWRRRLVFGTATAAGVCLVAAVTLAVVAAKERDNRFCVSCHLHEEKFDRFTSTAATDLAGVHQVKDRGVGCIACHGGADAGMRLFFCLPLGLRYRIGIYPRLFLQLGVKPLYRIKVGIDLFFRFTCHSIKSLGRLLGLRSGLFNLL